MSKKRKILVGSFILLFAGFLIYLYVDHSGKVARFRTMQDPLSPQEQINLAGLDKIKASGSGLPGFADIKNKLKNVTSPVIILDAIRESHGYVRGVSSLFLGYHIERPGLKHYIRRLVQTQTTTPLLNEVLSEEEEVKKYGFEYKYIQIRSTRESDPIAIDTFVEFIESLPSNVWVHIHCDHGRGRTSLMLAMIDILKNAPDVALEDIVKRQKLLGSEDLFDTTVWKRSSYTKEQLENRKKFLVNFYNFVIQYRRGGIQKWSDWVST